MQKLPEEYTVSKFKIFKTQKLGAGSFGHIFKGLDTETNEEVTIKVESKNMSCPQLKHESRLYELLQGQSKNNK